MNNNFPSGVWPTMLTPFTEKNEVDFEALESVVEWYIKNNVDGLFAVCQSSEMVCLSLEEKLSVAKFVKEKANGRVPVIASGHTSDSFEDQVKEINLMAEIGVDAVVLITNRLAGEDESDEVWKSNLEKLLKEIPVDVALGFYECPFPYKRIISPQLLKWCAATGRFYFLKDTSCDIENIKAKLEAVKGTGLKIYNANTATLLETLKLGVAGYSGIMANFHPKLYKWLVNNWSAKPEKARQLSNFLSIASLIEKQLYPVNAKYNLELEGLNIKINTRTKNHDEFTETNRLEIVQLFELTKEFSKQYII
ncbi:MAG: 4-hydroxy-tetrahydrodipicolinate synthase [Clostridium sp.]|jgi:4-hydroxy-tetrahydrodipicolinate synthase